MRGRPCCAMRSISATSAALTSAAGSGAAVHHRQLGPDPVDLVAQAHDGVAHALAVAQLRRHRDPGGGAVMSLGRPRIHGFDEIFAAGDDLLGVCHHGCCV